MNQRELARQLGLSESAVSRLAKRGMPTHSVEAARAWRRNKVNPYVKSQAAEPPPAPAPAPRPAAVPAVAPALDTPEQLQSFIAVTPDPIDFIEALADGAAIFVGDEAVFVADALGHALAQALKAGADAQRQEAALRAVMRALPSRLRERVALPTEVWRHLTRAFLQRHPPDPAGAAALAPEQAAEVGRHLYAVACGEWVPR